jgi:ADP-ribose pyrophosphatase YjhB (NUDIX family)/DNA polymerase III epsilon subunit-like protein/superfamily I DNA/RNA helicase
VSKRRRDTKWLDQLHAEAIALVNKSNSKFRPERQVTRQAALAVVDRSLTYTSNSSQEVRSFAALRALSSFISLATISKATVSSLENSDLLPVGHPFSTAPHAMSIGAFRSARAQWIASDPLIDDSMRALVASAHSLEPGSIERRHAFARLATAGPKLVPITAAIDVGDAEIISTYVPVPLVAGLLSFVGGNSRAARSMRAKLQRRDRYGRFAFMGGGFSFKMKMGDGSFRSFSGRVVGRGTEADADSGLVEVELMRGSNGLKVAGQIVKVPSNKGTAVKAIIPQEGLEGLPDQGEVQPDDVFVTAGEMIQSKTGAPDGWKPLKTAKDANGKEYTTQWESPDGYIVNGVGQYSHSEDYENVGPGSAGWATHRQPQLQPARQELDFVDFPAVDTWADVEDLISRDQNDYEADLKKYNSLDGDDAAQKAWFAEQEAKGRKNAADKPQILREESDAFAEQLQDAVGDDKGIRFNVNGEGVTLKPTEVTDTSVKGTDENGEEREVKLADIKSMSEEVAPAGPGAPGEPPTGGPSAPTGDPSDPRNKLQEVYNLVEEAKSIADGMVNAGEFDAANAIEADGLLTRADELFTEFVDEVANYNGNGSGTFKELVDSFNDAVRGESADNIPDFDDALSDILRDLESFDEGGFGPSTPTDGPTPPTGGTPTGEGGEPPKPPSGRVSGPLEPGESGPGWSSSRSSNSSYYHTPNPETGFSAHTITERLNPDGSTKGYDVWRMGWGVANQKAGDNKQIASGLASFNDAIDAIDADMVEVDKINSEAKEKATVAEKEAEAARFVPLGDPSAPGEKNPVANLTESRVIRTQGTVRMSNGDQTIYFDKDNGDGIYDAQKDGFRIVSKTSGGSEQRQVPKYRPSTGVTRDLEPFESRQQLENAINAVLSKGDNIRFKYGAKEVVFQPAKIYDNKKNGNRNVTGWSVTDGDERTYNVDKISPIAPKPAAEPAKATDISEPREPRKGMSIDRPGFASQRADALPYDVSPNEFFDVLSSDARPFSPAEILKELKALGKDDRDAYKVVSAMPPDELIYMYVDDDDTLYVGKSPDGEWGQWYFDEDLQDGKKVSINDKDEVWGGGYDASGEYVNFDFDGFRDFIKDPIGNTDKLFTPFNWKWIDSVDFPGTAMAGNNIVSTQSYRLLTEDGKKELKEVLDDPNKTIDDALDLYLGGLRSVPLDTSKPIVNKHGITSFSDSFPKDLEVFYSADAVWIAELSTTIKTPDGYYGRFDLNEETGFLEVILAKDDEEYWKKAINGFLQRSSDRDAIREMELGELFVELQDLLSEVNDPQEPDTIDFNSYTDPLVDLNRRRIEMAMDKKQKLRVNYKGKDRVIDPQRLWVNPKTGKELVTALDMSDGGKEKNFFVNDLYGPDKPGGQIDPPILTPISDEEIANSQQSSENFREKLESDPGFKKFVEDSPQGTGIERLVDAYDSTQQDGPVDLTSTNKDGLRSVIEDAIASGKDVSFVYHEKPRVVKPLEITVNPKNNRPKLRGLEYATDAEKEFFFDKFAEPVDNKLKQTQLDDIINLPQEELDQVVDALWPAPAQAPTAPPVARKKETGLQEIDTKQSTAVSRAAYDPQTQEFFIQFGSKDGKGGGIYKYADVPQDFVDRFAASDSLGKMVPELKKIGKSEKVNAFPATGAAAQLLDDLAFRKAAAREFFTALSKVMEEYHLDFEDLFGLGVEEEVERGDRGLARAALVQLDDAFESITAVFTTPLPQSEIDSIKDDFFRKYKKAMKTWVRSLGEAYDFSRTGQNAPGVEDYEYNKDLDDAFKSDPSTLIEGMRRGPRKFIFDIGYTEDVEETIRRYTEDYGFTAELTGSEWHGGYPEVEVTVDDSSVPDTDLAEMLGLDSDSYVEAQRQGDKILSGYRVDLEDFYAEGGGDFVQNQADVDRWTSQNNVQVEARFISPGVVRYFGSPEDLRDAIAITAGKDRVDEFMAKAYRERPADEVPTTLPGEIDDSQIVESTDASVFSEAVFDEAFPAVGEGFYKVNIFDRYKPKGPIDGVQSSDYTDDPKVLANKFSIITLLWGLKDAISPDEETGAPATGYAQLKFDKGDEYVNAEAIYAAIVQSDPGNSELLLAGIYDRGVGGEENTDRANERAAARAKERLTATPDDFSKSIINVPTKYRFQQMENAKLLNGMLANPESASRVVRALENFVEPNDKLIAIAQNLMSIQDSDPDPDDVNMGTLLDQYLPLATSPSDDDRDAFRGLWGMLMSLDGGDSADFEGLTDDDDHFRARLFQALVRAEGSEIAAQEAYEELISTYGGYPEFVIARKRLADGEDSIDAKTTAAAFARLVAAAARPNTVPLYRYIAVSKDNDPLLDMYTTKGSIFDMDTRSFTSSDVTNSDPEHQDSRNKGHDRVFFVLEPGDGMTVAAHHVSPFEGEKEHFGYGTFEVVSVKSSFIKLGSLQEKHVVQIKQVSSRNQVEDFEPNTENVVPNYGDISMWKEVRVGSQAGTNEGGFFKDPYGNQYYIKRGRSQSHVDNETLATAFYNELGIPAPDQGFGMRDGELWLVSPIISDKRDFSDMLDNEEFMSQVRDGFAVDAWLSNYDVTGYIFDNIVPGTDGEPFRIDNGGALRWRAQGTPKPWFDEDVTELDTMRDPKLSRIPAAAKVFGGMTEDDVARSARRLLDITPTRIIEMVTSAIKDPDEAREVARILVARREQILSRYGLDTVNPDADILGEPTSLATSMGYAARDLQPQDVTAGDSFTIERVFHDAKTPKGKVSVEGYFPGHETQRKEWNEATTIDVFRGAPIPPKGDKPALHRPKRPFEPNPPAFTGAAAELLDGAANWEEVRDRLRDKEVIFFDYETTGFPDRDKGDFSTNQPVQLGAVRVVNGEVVDRFNIHMNPGEPLGLWSREYLKRDGDVLVTDEWLSGQPGKDDAHRQFTEWAGQGAIFAAHNAPFDIGVFNKAAADAGIDYTPAGVIDTLKLSQQFMPSKSQKVKPDPNGPLNHKLPTLVEFFGGDLKGWHTADADAEAVASVLDGILGAITDKPLPDLAKDAQKYKQDKEKFDRAKKEYAEALLDYETAKAVAAAWNCGGGGIKAAGDPYGEDCNVPSVDDIIKRATPDASDFVDPDGIHSGPTDGSSSPLPDRGADDQEDYIIPFPENVDPAELFKGEKFMPTQQQQNIIAAWLTGEDVVVLAKAGTGKTTTLTLGARVVQGLEPSKNLLYIAYNKSVADEARAKFPPNTVVKTSDAVAYNFMKNQYPDLFKKFKSDTALFNKDDIAKFLGLSGVKIGEDKYEASEIASMVQDTVFKFEISADSMLDERHVFEADVPSELRDTVLSAAQVYWSDILNPGGQMPFAFNEMKKLWSMSKPDFAGLSSGVDSRIDVVMLDEAQDTNDAVGSVVLGQPSAQVIMVGDPDQAIYQFNGAKDQLQNAVAPYRLPLTESWRYGPEIGGFANRFLSLKEKVYGILTNRGIGRGPAGEVAVPGTMEDAEAVIVRSNAGAFKDILIEIEAGRTVGVTKSFYADLKGFIEATEWLQAGGTSSGKKRPARMPEDLRGFRTWKDVVNESAKGDKSDLGSKTKILVETVETEGIKGLYDILGKIKQIESVSDAKKSMGDGTGTGPSEFDIPDEVGVGAYGQLTDGISFSVDPIGIAITGKKTFPYKDEIKKVGAKWNADSKVWKIPAKTDDSRRAALEKLQNLIRDLEGFGSTTEERAAQGIDVVVSTAHQMKGLEFGRVRVGGDFRGPRVDKDTEEIQWPSISEFNLAYVTATRAINALDPGSLKWIYDATTDKDETPFPVRDGDEVEVADEEQEQETTPVPELDSESGDGGAEEPPAVPVATGGDGPSEDEQAVYDALDTVFYAIQDAADSKGNKDFGAKAGVNALIDLRKKLSVIFSDNPGLNDLIDEVITGINAKKFDYPEDGVADAQKKLPAIFGREAVQEPGTETAQDDSPNIVTAPDMPSVDEPVTDEKVEEVLGEIPELAGAGSFNLEFIRERFAEVDNMFNEAATNMTRPSSKTIVDDTREGVNEVLRDLVAGNITLDDAYERLAEVADSVPEIPVNSKNPDAAEIEALADYVMSIRDAIEEVKFGRRLSDHLPPPELLNKAGEPMGTSKNGILIRRGMRVRDRNGFAGRVLEYNKSDWVGVFIRFDLDPRDSEAVKKGSWGPGVARMIRTASTLDVIGEDEDPWVDTRNDAKKQKDAEKGIDPRPPSFDQQLEIYNNMIQRRNEETWSGEESDRSDDDDDDDPDGGGGATPPEGPEPGGDSGSDGMLRIPKSQMGQITDDLFANTPNSGVAEMRGIYLTDTNFKNPPSLERPLSQLSDKQLSLLRESVDRVSASLPSEIDELQAVVDGGNNEVSNAMLQSLKEDQKTFDAIKRTLDGEIGRRGNSPKAEAPEGADEASEDISREQVDTSKAPEQVQRNKKYEFVPVENPEKYQEDLGEIYDSALGDDVNDANATAMRLYQEDPNMWVATNYRLRGTKLASQLEEEYDVQLSDIDRVVKAFDEEIDKVPGLPKNTLLYRGTRSNSAERLFSLPVGEEFTDLGFASTSLEYDVAKEFSGTGDGGELAGVILEIEAPTGTKAISLAAYFGDETDSETEVVLARGTTFTVVSKTDATDSEPRKMRIAVVDQTEIADQEPVPVDEEDVSYNDIENWTRIGAQQGSNPGGTYRDENGNAYYVKKPRTDLHAQNEALAAALYKELQVPAVEVLLGEENGELRTVSPMVESTGVLGYNPDREVVEKLQEGFAVDAWLANWDVAGLMFDNVIIDKDGNPVRVDPGGALMWRAQGEPKGKIFGDVVGEIDTLRDKGMAKEASVIFGDMTDEQVKESAKVLLNISPERIDEIVDSIISDFADAADLKMKLRNRRQNILDRFGLTDADKIAEAVDEPLAKEETVPDNSTKTVTTLGADVSMPNVLIEGRGAAPDHTPRDKELIAKLIAEGPQAMGSEFVENWAKAYENYDGSDTDAADAAMFIWEMGVDAIINRATTDELVQNAVIGIFASTMSYIREALPPKPGWGTGRPQLKNDLAEWREDFPTDLVEKGRLSEKVFWIDLARYFDTPELIDIEMTPASAFLRILRAWEGSGNPPQEYDRFLSFYNHKDSDDDHPLKYMFTVGQEVVLRPSSWTDVDELERFEEFLAAANSGSPDDWVDFAKDNEDQISPLEVGHVVLRVEVDNAYAIDDISHVESEKESIIPNGRYRVKSVERVNQPVDALDPSRGFIPYTRVTLEVVPLERKKKALPTSALAEAAKELKVNLDVYFDEALDIDDVEQATNKFSLAKTEHMRASDAVIIKPSDGGDLIAMIEREFGPFRGAYALPGGMLDVGETFAQAADREMKEEVGFDAANATSRKNLGAVTNSPDWDPRFVNGVSVGAVSYVVPDDAELNAQDDARSAMWVPVEDLANGVYPIAFGHAAWLAEHYKDDPILGEKFEVIVEASKERNGRLIEKINKIREELDQPQFTLYGKDAPWWNPVAAVEEEKVEEAPEAFDGPLELDYQEWRGGSVTYVDEDGVTIGLDVRYDDVYALKNGSLEPPALPFFVPLYGTGEKDSGEGYYFAKSGKRYWGRYGAAGALLRRTREDGTIEYLLAKRSANISAGGGQWAWPGGAHKDKKHAESPRLTAYEELKEELGIYLEGIEPVAAHINFVEPDWWYETIIVDVTDNSSLTDSLKISDDENSELGWFTEDAIRELEESGMLHPAVASSIEDVLAVSNLHSSPLKMPEYTPETKAEVPGSQQITPTGRPKVTPENPLPLSASGIDGTYSLMDAIHHVKNSDDIAVSTFVDGGDIEDLEVRAAVVIDEPTGEKKISLRFKLTYWAGKKLLDPIRFVRDINKEDVVNPAKIKALKLSDDLSEAEITEKPVIPAESYIDPTSGVVVTTGNMAKITQFGAGPESMRPAIYEGSILRIDDSNGKTGAVYEIVDEDGEEFYLPDLNIPIQDRPYTHDGPAKSYNNMVNIYLPLDATEEQIATALRAAGVQDVRAASKEDLKVIAENRLLSVFRQFTDPRKNVEDQQVREELLDSIAETENVTADDVEFRISDTGRVEMLLSEEKAKELAEKLEINRFEHEMANMRPALQYYVDNPGVMYGGMSHVPRDYIATSAAKSILRTLSANKLNSTMSRMLEGNQNVGLSSDADIKKGSADYVFTTPTHVKTNLSDFTKEESSHNLTSTLFIFSAEKLLRRLDIYGNRIDKFGERFNSHDIYGEINLGEGAKKEAYEAMFKNDIEFGEYLEYVSVAEEIRAEILDMLNESGISTMYGIPVEELFVTHGDVPNREKVAKHIAEMADLVEDLEQKQLSMGANPIDFREFANVVANLRSADPSSGDTWFLPAPDGSKVLAIANSMHGNPTLAIYVLEPSGGLYIYDGTNSTTLSEYHMSTEYMRRPVSKSSLTYTMDILNSNDSGIEKFFTYMYGTEDKKVFTELSLSGVSRYDLPSYVPAGVVNHYLSEETWRESLTNLIEIFYDLKSPTYKDVPISSILASWALSNIPIEAREALEKVIDDIANQVRPVVSAATPAPVTPTYVSSLKYLIETGNIIGGIAGLETTYTTGEKTIKAIYTVKRHALEKENGMIAIVLAIGADDGTRYIELKEATDLAFDKKTGIGTFSTVSAQYRIQPLESLHEEHDSKNKKNRQAK